MKEKNAKNLLAGDAKLGFKYLDGNGRRTLEKWSLKLPVPVADHTQKFILRFINHFLILAIAERKSQSQNQTKLLA